MVKKNNDEEVSLSGDCKDVFFKTSPFLSF